MQFAEEEHRRLRHLVARGIVERMAKGVYRIQRVAGDVDAIHSGRRSGHLETQSSAILRQRVCSVSSDSRTTLGRVHGPSRSTRARIPQLGDCPLDDVSAQR